MVDIMARRKTTNVVHAKYTEIVDLQTVAGKTSIIGIHSPCTGAPVQKLSGLYTAFRFVKYHGCRLNMVPQANLPIDPLGLTGQLGTTDLMDPRDMLNPILTHGCHGEHLGKVLDSIYGTLNMYPTPGIGSKADSDVVENSDSAIKVDVPNSVDTALSRYYNCLTDVTWKKHSIQAPLSLRCYPLINKLASNFPIVPAYTSSFNAALRGQLVDNFDFESETTVGGQISDGSPDIRQPLDFDQSAGLLFPPMFASTAGADSTIMPQFFTNGLTKMGWLPTSTSIESGDTKATLIPKQFMTILVMPPQYNVEQFFRMSITHSFSFAGFTTSLGNMDFGGLAEANRTTSYFNWIDYDTTKEDTGSKFVSTTSLDLIDADAEVIADGVR